MNEMQQVVMNLLLNARDAIRERRWNANDKTIKGEVNITIKDGDGLDIIVADNGAGISEDIEGKMFEAYKTTKQEGTGIGTYTSKLIVNKYPNSYMKAENRSDGGAAIITVHIGSKEVKI
jgi:signal transduction histidine kinase